MDIGIIILAIVGGLIGLFSTLYLAFSMPAVIIWKFYRKIRFGIALTK